MKTQVAFALILALILAQTFIGAAPCAKAHGGEPGSNAGNREQGEPAASNAPQEPRVLVAYFSCTGTTKGVAEQIADAIGADLFAIAPETPYTDDDLNYRDSASRSSREQGDAAARPAIHEGVEDMSAYDTVFLGYPIWWGEAPRIVCTFLESHDFAGKTIVPFCTSGSSGIGSSADNLHALCDVGTAWLPGARLSGGASGNEIANWIADLGLDGA